MQHQRREARGDRDPRRRAAGASRTAPRRRTPAAPRTAASPRIPCSAATVTGIVCEAEVAFSALAALPCCARLYSRFERARAVALAAAVRRTVRGRPRSRLARPLVALLAEPPEPFRPKCRLAGASSTTTPASASAASATYTASRARSSTTPPAPPGPSSSAAMLDCEKLVTSPASSHSSTAPPTSTSRRRSRSYAEPRERAPPPPTADHHERQEAPVDARVEEHRVDAEVVVVLVGRDHLRVQEQRLAVVLDEADAREQHRQRDRHARGSAAAAGASSARRAGSGTAARTARRRRRCSRPPWRGRPSRASAARTGRPPRTAAIRRRAASPGGQATGSRRFAAERALARLRRAARQQPRQQVHERARGDDQVQRYQQVHGPAVGRDRQPEGQREHRQQRERVGVAAHHARRAPRSRPARATSASASVPALGRRVGERAHGLTSVKLRGESTGLWWREADAHAVFARRRDRAFVVWHEDRCALPAWSRARRGAALPRRPFQRSENCL